MISSPLAFVGQPPSGKIRQAADTAVASRGLRDWVDESGALIRTPEDFERFPWDRIHAAPETSRNGCQFYTRGHEGHCFRQLCLRTFSNPSLVMKGSFSYCMMIRSWWKAFSTGGGRSSMSITSRVWSVIGGCYLPRRRYGLQDRHNDFPSDLRRLLFPWLAKYAALAHEHGKPFWIHSCGNLYRNSPSVMDDLIDVVRIDGFHSFQDVILPVSEVKRQYGDRLALMGGVDMDKLATLPESELRSYLRAILNCLYAWWKIRLRFWQYHRKLCAFAELRHPA